MKLWGFIIFIIFLNPLQLFSQPETLPGKVTIEFSKGYELRAKTLQNFVLSAETFYEQMYPVYIFKVKLKLLDKVDWDKLSYKMPYGLPHFRTDLVMGADKRAMFNDTTSDNEISSFDAIVLHELGHYFMTDLVKTDIYPNWANEFIATYFQICYSEVKGIHYITSVNTFIPSHRTLEDFEKGFNYIGGAESYGWYQQQFMKLGRRLYFKYQNKILDKFIENYQPGGKQQNALELLQSIDLDITNTWLKEMQ